MAEDRAVSRLVQMVQRRERMKEVQKYRCEKCNREFDKKEDALLCESSHLCVKGIINCEYDKELLLTPKWLTVELSNGDEAVYEYKHLYRCYLHRKAVEMMAR